MRILARGVKLANVAAVQRPYDADTRKHRRAARRRYKDQGLHCGLPLRGLVFSLRKSRDVFAGVRERDSWRPRGNGIGSSKRRFQPRSATGVDRHAQALHGDFDILRLQVAPALDLGLVVGSVRNIPQAASWRPFAPW